ncbi:MAG: type II toxin-antitoxin system VapC family toxin [Candidatus Diapherotrites archaeon]
MRRIYLDSNVFISFINKEIGRNVRGLFVEVKLFLEKVKEKEGVLVLSEWFFREAERYCYLTKDEILRYFRKNRIKTEVIEEKETLSLKGFRGRGIHYADLLHAATAIKYKCDCIVTFNVNDFEKIKDKIEIFEPLEFT